MSTELEKRLSEYEVKPPAATWDAIAAALDETAHPFVQKMQDYESLPGAPCWDKIQDELAKAEQADTHHVLPFHRRHAGLIKYISAAAILIVLAVSISLLFTPKYDSEIAVSSGGKPGSAAVQSGKDHFLDTNTNGVSNETGQKAEKSQISTVAGTLARRFSSNRYIAFTNKRGKTVKLSKKVMPVFDCADNATASSRIRCKENIKTLQQKMASSTLSPTTDFAGLIDMIKKLEDN